MCRSIPSEGLAFIPWVVGGGLSSLSLGVVMKRIYPAVVGLALAAIPSTATPASLRPNSCFICDDYQLQFFVWKHNDYFFFLNELSGTNHGYQAEGSCGTSGHHAYQEE